MNSRFMTAWEMRRAKEMRLNALVQRGLRLRQRIRLLIATFVALLGVGLAVQVATTATLAGFAIVLVAAGFAVAAMRAGELLADVDEAIQEGHRSMR